MTREVYVRLLDRDGDTASFEVRFHDGYQKIYYISQYECSQDLVTERDVLENLISDYYLDTEKIHAHINFIFY